MLQKIFSQNIMIYFSELCEVVRRIHAIRKYGAGNSICHFCHSRQSERDVYFHQSVSQGTWRFVQNITEIVCDKSGDFCPLTTRNCPLVPLPLIGSVLYRPLPVLLAICASWKIGNKACLLVPVGHLYGQVKQ